MCLSFLLAVVLFHQASALKTQRRCNATSDCYRHIDENTTVSSDVLWRCCRDHRCHRFSGADPVLRCTCYSESDKSRYCHHDEKCNLHQLRCVPVRHCVQDSDCYRAGDGLFSWRCCPMDKQCSLNRGKDEIKKSKDKSTGCKCSDYDDSYCLSNEICGGSSCLVVTDNYCKQDSDCSVGKECNQSENSCILTHTSFLVALIIPTTFFFGSLFILMAYCAIRRRRRERRARFRPATRAPPAPQHSRPREARGGRACQTTASQSVDTSPHNDSTEQPRVPLPHHERPSVTRKDIAIQSTELQSAGCSTYNDNTVTVRPAPTAPPFIPSVAFTSTEEARGAITPSDKEEYMGIAVSSGATAGFFTEPPPPSYEDVMRNM